MKSFSIKELENLTGIKAHTIRIWERRYAVLTPERSTGNIRRYTIDELERLMNLSLLCQQNRISQLTRLSDHQLIQALSELKEERERWCKAINELVVQMYRIDTERFEALLDECFHYWPVSTVVQEIIFPFLKKVGLLHHYGQRLEELLAAAAVRRKLHWSIEKAGPAKTRNRTALLFLMGERQSDLLLLYLHYHLKKEGWRVIDLGLHASLKNLEDLLMVAQPHYLFTYLTTRSRVLFPPLCHKQKSASLSANLVVAGVDENSRARLRFQNIRELSCADALRLACEENFQQVKLPVQEEQQY